MKRRHFLALLGGATNLVAWPLASRAQQSLPVVGFLSGRSLATDSNLVAAFRQGLAGMGYADGRDVSITYRWAEGQFDRLPALAADLVKLRADVIFGGGLDIKIRAVRNTISTVPAVFATGGDPVKLGVVASMNRPGGSATAVTVLTAELWPKRLELLRSLLPSITQIALLLDPTNPSADDIKNDLRAAAKVVGVQVHVASASSDRELESAFAGLTRERAGALMVTADPLFIGRRKDVIGLAGQYSLPAMYDRRDFAVDGGLMSYGASIVDQYLQSGRYVGRILKGARPVDLPVMQPTKFEFVINTKTAKTLGLSIPPNLLALADEVIE